MTTDLTGPVAAFGKAEAAAWRAQFDMVNAQGGIDGHKVQLRVLDDQSDPAKAHANVLQLVNQDHVIALQGSVLSGQCSALADLVTQKKVPMLCNAVSSDLLKPVHPYVFDEYDSEVTMAEPLLKWTQEHFKKSPAKVVVIGGQVPAIKAWASRMNDLAPKYDVDVVKTITPPVENTDMKAIAAQVSAVKPDVVYVEATAENIVALQNNLQTNGTPTAIVALNTAYSAFQQSANPKLLFQLNQVNFVDVNSTETGPKNYVKWMAKQGMKGASALNSSNVVIYYAAAANLVAALKTCGQGCTGEKLRSSLEQATLTIPGITGSGTYGYTADSHIPNKVTDIYQWDADKRQPVVVGEQLPLGDL